MNLYTKDRNALMTDMAKYKFPSKQLSKLLGQLKIPEEVCSTGAQIFFKIDHVISNTLSKS